MRVLEASRMRALHLLTDGATRVITTAVVMIALVAPCLNAQGSRKDDIVFGPSGHPVAGATVTVCQPTATSTPCAPLATIYTDATLTVPAANPFQTDGIGNYHFYAPAGRYLIQISGPQITGTITYPDVILPPDVSSTGAGNNISAFGLTLGGNLSVAGNATISGTLTTSNFNPGNFTPSSLSVLGDESVLGPRPRVDVTAYGAKGDGSTDDTAAITAAINTVCASGSLGGSIYFPPGGYRVSQPQTPSTSAIFTPCGRVHFIGGNDPNAGGAQFIRAPSVTILVIPGSSPNNAAVFALNYPAGDDTFENLTISGYNQAVSDFSATSITFNNVCLNSSVTGQADNTPLKLTDTFWIFYNGGCLQSNSGTVPVAEITGENNPGGQEAGGLTYFRDMLIAGGAFDYIQRVANAGSGPANIVFRNITRESSSDDFFKVTNTSGSPMPSLTSLTIDHVDDADSLDPSAALINFNDSLSSLSGVWIDHSYAGQGIGVAIRMTAGTLDDYFLTNCDGCTTAVVNSGTTAPVGSGVETTQNGFDAIVGTNDNCGGACTNQRLRNDYLSQSSASNATNSGSAFRLFQSGSNLASVELDPLDGLLFSDGRSYGFNANIYEAATGGMDFGYAAVLPPTNVVGTPTTGGSLAAGTYYYSVRACLTPSCTVGTEYSAPSLISSAVVLTGSNNAVAVTWTDPSAGLVTPWGYLVTRSMTPTNCCQSQPNVVVSGATTTSYIDTGFSTCFACSTTPSTAVMLSAHRLTYSGLALNGGVNYCADTGSANAYACTVLPMPNLNAGTRVEFLATHSNTGASTFSLTGTNGSFGAIAIKKNGNANNLASGDIAANQIVDVEYDGTQWEMQSTLGNAASGSGAVSSVSNSDGTLTISPTTGAVVASLALGHANTWTGTQTFPSASITNAELANAATTVNGQSCALGSTCNVNASDAAHSVAVNEGAGAALAGTANSSAGQVLRSNGTIADPAFTDFPDIKYIPAVNCTNATAGSGWSLPTSSAATPACRTGTNIQDGVMQYTTTSSSAQFSISLPEDWDTSAAGLPYIRLNVASTDVTSGHTIIMQAAVSCSGTSGATDDNAFQTAQSLSTVTLGTTANQSWTTSVQFNSTSMTGCVPWGMMHVKVSGNTGTATNVNVYGAMLTIPRLITVQAN